MSAKFFSIFISSLLFWSCGTKSGETQNDSGNATDSVQTETQTESDSSKTYVLKWKAVSTSEYGNWYEFVDEGGNDFHADHLDIPNFSEDNNEYFTRTPVEGTPFAQYQIKSEVKDKWFEVKV